MAENRELVPRDVSPGDAVAALVAARRAKSAATGTRPVPGWFPPLAGLVFAAGSVSLAEYSEHSDLPVLLALAGGCFVAFLVSVAAASRAGGVAPAPAGTARQRWVRQLLGLLPLVAGALAAVPFGVAGCVAVAGTGLGLVAGIQLDRSRRGIPV